MKFIFISLTIFFLGIFIGYFSANGLRSMVEEVESFFSPLAGLPLPILTIIILVNNIFKTFLHMILGVLFAIPPVIFALINGLILGVIGFFVVEEKGLLFLLAGILPHGILEIPALLLSCALGIKIGMSIIRKIRGENLSISSIMGSCIKFYFKTVAPLLLLAAFVEVYVTPLLLQ